MKAPLFQQVESGPGGASHSNGTIENPSAFAPPVTPNVTVLNSTYA